MPNHALLIHIAVPSKLWFDWLFVIGINFASNNILFDGSVLFASFYFKNKRLKLKAATVTDHIRDAARACFKDIGVNPDELTA